MVQRLFGSLTARGRSFVAAGVAAMGCGLAVREPHLVQAGALLAALPAVSALSVRGSRHRLSSRRWLDPPLVPVGQPAVVTARVENFSPLGTGTLLAEDVIPHPLGSKPRFALDGIPPGESRELSYQIRSGTRGKFTIGPLQILVADPFGLVEIRKSASETSTLLVAPATVPLPPGSWPGQGDGRMLMASTAGADHQSPRVYRQGDSLHQVHWKATARHGQLMVRDEEQQQRKNASIFLDTRCCAHSGSGRASSFELAVSAVASIGTRLAGEGFRVGLTTAAGEITSCGTFSDTLLDTLAVIAPSSDVDLRAGTSALASDEGQLIAVAGWLSAQEAAALAACRRGNAPAMALLLAVSAWATGGPCADAARAAEILAAAGWRVAVVTASTPLTAAWQELHRPAVLGESSKLSGTA
jgi:uncharacterized protein (DUF58 family)